MHTVRNLDKGIWKKFVVYCKLEDVKVADELNKILGDYLKKHFKIKKMMGMIILLNLFFMIMLFQIISVRANTYLWENTTWESDLTGTSWVSTIFGDVDNDNDLDLAVIGCTGLSGSSCNSYLSKIYINNGSSLAINSTWSENLTQVDYGSIAFGDVDNDGDLDLVLTGCSNGGGNIATCNTPNSFIYINNGLSFIENRTFKGDVADVWKGSVALGDINSDGKLDLVLTGQTTTTNIAKIYINNGTGFAENSTWQSNLTGVFESALVLGDINNDNKLDLILTGDESNADRVAEVYINNGNSLVQNSTWSNNLLAVDQSAVVLGDYDSDGDLDLSLIGHTTSDRHEIYNNTGTTFILVDKEVPSGNLAGIFQGSQAFGDYDNDGDLDLITTGEEEYTTLYLYNGTLFTSYTEDPESGLMNPEFGPSLVWGDVDNDSDLDLILMGVDSVDTTRKAKIYINNISTPNTKPNAPNSSFNATFDDGKLILSWGNGSDAETSVKGLYYNIRVGTASGGNNVISGVYGGGDDNGYFGNMMQRKSISIKGLSASTTYYYSVQTIDTGLAKSSWSNEQSYTTAVDIINPSIEYIFPADNYYSNKNYVYFGANITDETNLANVSLYGDWTGNTVINQTNSTGVNGNHTFNVSLNDGTYHFYIQACDATGNCGESSTRTIYVDTTYPNINLSSPDNASTWTSSSTVTFIYNVSDLAINNCSLIINNDIDQTDDSVSVNVLQNFTKTMSNGNYNWSVNCTDQVAHLNNSETRLLTVNYVAPVISVSSGSTTGSGGSAAGAAAAEAIRAASPVAAESVPKVWFSIAKGEEKTYENKKEEISVSEITFNVESNAEQAQISVSALKSNPVSSIPKPVYQYLEINNKNIDTKEAKIKFNVEKQWIDENNIDKSTVKLNRYTDEWNELITNEIGSDYNNIIYESISPGFSYFAVTGENKTVVEEVKEVVEKEDILEEKPEVKEKKVSVLIWIIAIFSVLLIWYHYVVKLKKKK